MNYATQSCDELYVIGISVHTANSRPEEISALWQRFRETAMQEIPGPLSPEPYGVYFDYEGDHTAPFTLLAGLLVAPDVEAPPGMIKRQIPAATYAVFPATGSLPDAVMAAWQTISNTDVPRTYLADFEVYHSPESFDIYVGIA